jgi:RNA polymerase sigma factor (TIGR02999 family)
MGREKHSAAQSDAKQNCSRVTGRPDNKQVASPMTTPSSPQQRLTELLCEWRAGDAAAFERLLPLVQPELQRLAHRYMSRERPGHTLQTTALLDDAYLRLADSTHPRWQNRAHFFAVAAQLMRRIMVDHARQRQALKRGGGTIRVALDESAAVTQTRADELLALDEALESLAIFEPRKARVVELRYFGGLAMEEIAQVLKIHVNTVTRDWSSARAWLRAALSGEDMNAS